MNSDLRQMVVLFFIFGGGFWVLAPLAQAVAKRIRGREPAALEPQAMEDLRDELRQVRQELAELHERTDFTERMLARRTDDRPLGPPPAQ
jgi:hypothetical protein